MSQRFAFFGFFVVGFVASAEAQDPVARLATLQSVRLTVTSSNPEITFEELAPGISHELGGITVVPAGLPADGAIDVVVEGTRAHVTYVSPTSPPIDRWIELPAHKDGAMETIALLAGNLSRREADELLATLAGAGTPLPTATVVTEAPPAELPEAAPQQQPPAPQDPPPAAPAEPPLDHVPFSIGFVPYLSTDFADALDRTHGFSFAPLGTMAGGLDGFGFSGIADIRTRHVHGFQFAGVAAISGGPASGVQFGGVTSVARGFERGAQFAGVAAIGGDVSAAQFAGVLAEAERLDGLQAAGVISIAGESSGVQLGGIASVGRGMDGLQLSGVANISGGHIDGAQIGGILNVAREVDGFQGGLVNVTGDVDGAQVGLVNIGGRVRGAQVGLVNVSRDADFSLGLVSIHTEGRTNVEAWIETAGFGAIALRHGGTYTHTIVAIGGAPFSDQPTAMFGLGWGARPLSTDLLKLDIDGLCFWMVEDFSEHGVHLFPQIRGTLGIDLGPFELLVGVGVGVEIAEQGARQSDLFPRIEVGRDHGRTDDSPEAIRPSAFVGLRL